MENDGPVTWATMWYGHPSHCIDRTPKERVCNPTFFTMALIKKLRVSRSEMNGAFKQQGWG